MHDNVYGFEQVNIFKLGLSLIYYVYALYDNEYKRILKNAWWVRLYSRALHVGKMTFNQHALRLKQDWDFE